MSNAPHGGILKASFSRRTRRLCILIRPAQDLLVRDEPIKAQLKAEAASLPEIVLTEVDNLQMFTMMAVLTSTFIRSANCATSS